MTHLAHVFTQLTHACTQFTGRISVSVLAVIKKPLLDDGYDGSIGTMGHIGSNVLGMGWVG
jgi:hypothetical protein